MRSLRRLALVLASAEGLMLVLAIGLTIAVLVRGIPTDADLFSGTFFGIEAATFPAIGLPITLRQPRNAIGWILLGIGASAMTGTLSPAIQAYAVDPPVGLAIATSWLWVPSIGLMGTFLLLLFPDGKLPSPGWRFVGWASAAALIVASLTILTWPGPMADLGHPELNNPIGIYVPEPLRLVLLASFPAIPVCILACAASVAVRYRRSTGVARLQLGWLAAAGATVAVMYGLAFIPTSVVAPWVNDLLRSVAVFSFVLIPIAIGIAILRYRLYDLGRLINRTLVYAVLTAILGTVYVASVILMGSLVRSIAGGELNDVAVAASTLVVASLFRPIRGRVQAFIDRRFYRRRYDAARLVTAFGLRLRSQTDLEALNRDLLDTVAETVQPAHAALWWPRRPPGPA